MKHILISLLIAIPLIAGLSGFNHSFASLESKDSLSPGVIRATDRARLLAEIETLRNQLKSREQEFLSPTAEDKAAFAKYLTSSDTGLIRLLPRAQSEAQSKLSIRGGGAYYSFTGLTHEYGYGSDIEFQNGVFSVGFAGADYGFLATLGDVPLESISPDTLGVQLLSNLKSPVRMSEARAQQRLSSEGFEQDGIVYKRMAGAVVGNTYVVRSVNIDRSDVLVGFRVVRKDEDGSLILLWKMLKQYPAPTVIRDAQ